MRALAEFIMRGRAQAIAVAAISMLLQLPAVIGIAVVGLVTLRRGAKDGVVVMAWALLPLLVLVSMGGNIGSVVALLAVMVAALSLRATRAWPQALLVAVAAGVVSALLFSTIATSYAERWIAGFNQLMAVGQQRQQGEALLPHMNSTAASGVLGFGVCLLVTTGLLIARWWQAMLYNPGGFRDEFHQLRLPPAVAVGLMVVGIGLTGFGEFGYWMIIFTVPLLIAGLALVHGVVGRRGLGRWPLVVMYLVLLLIGWFATLLLLLALIDSFVNFRARIKPRASN